MFETVEDYSALLVEMPEEKEGVQKTPLAHIVLKTDKIGNSIPKRYVTPAELMFLVADNRANVGDNPINKITIVKEKPEIEEMEKLASELKQLVELMTSLEKQELTPEIRDRREASYRSQAARRVVRFNELLAIWHRRRMSPLDERARLEQFYGLLRVRRFYTGQFPTLPMDFDTANKAGLQSSTRSACLLGNPTVE